MWVQKYSIILKLNKTQLILASNVWSKIAGVKLWDEPILAQRPGDQAVEDGTLELNCTVVAERGAKLEIKWKLPNENIAIKVWIEIHWNGWIEKISSYISSIQEGRVRFSSPIHQNHGANSSLYKAIDKIVISRLAKKKDIGFYECLVEDHYGNHKSATLNVDNIIGLYFEIIICFCLFIFR